MPSQHLAAVEWLSCVPRWLRFPCWVWSDRCAGQRCGERSGAALLQGRSALLMTTDTWTCDGDSSGTSSQRRGFGLAGRPAASSLRGVRRRPWLVGVRAWGAVLRMAPQLDEFHGRHRRHCGVEVLTVTVGGASLYYLTHPEGIQWLAPIVLASAALGFLVWNWPPAKIFMGDAGSGFLGVMLAVLSVQAAWVLPTLFWSWLTLLGAFVVDATVTLARRMARRERLSEAHRSHAYQHAARRWAAHRPVSVGFGLINVLWLFPLSLLVATGRLDGVMGVSIGYAPLVAAAWWLGLDRLYRCGRSQGVRRRSAVSMFRAGGRALSPWGPRGVRC